LILPSDSKLPLSILINKMTSPQNWAYRKLIFVKLTLHLWHSKLPLSILINRMTSPQNCSYRKLIFVKLTLHFWHSKLALSILINRMISPQNCSYCKSIFISLTSHLWQIIVKFNTTPLTMIKLLPSSTLNLWQPLFLKLQYWNWDERCQV